MNFILEYSKYRNEQDLILPKGIVLSNRERMDIGNLISNIISNIYGDKLNSEMSFNIDGKIINPEYLRKARNNRTLLKKLVYDEYKEIATNIKNKVDLFKFIEENGESLFSPNGVYFDAVYNLLSLTSTKGSKLEDRAFEFFQNALEKKRGIRVEITKPTTSEDISGLDGIFIYKGKRFTLQVKPLLKMESYLRDNTKYIVFCDGVLKNLKTDYLIVTNDKETHIFKTEGITSHSSYFLIPIGNLVV